MVREVGDVVVGVSGADPDTSVVGDVVNARKGDLGIGENALANRRQEESGALGDVAVEMLILIMNWSLRETHASIAEELVSFLAWNCACLKGMAAAKSMVRVASTRAVFEKNIMSGVTGFWLPEQEADRIRSDLLDILV